MNLQINNFYTEKLQKYSAEQKSTAQKIKQFAWSRLLAFATIFLPLFIFGLKSWITLIISAAALILFFWLIKKNIHFEQRNKKLTALKRIVEDELLALKHSFLHFKNGSEFLDTNHFFSYDLDLFGEGSVFQFINRTSTKAGEQKLASWLISPSIEKSEIEKKQKAIQELSQIPNWRLHFLANGKLYEETEEMDREIRSWSAMDMFLRHPQRVKWLIRIIPFLTLLSIVPSVLGISDLFLVVTIFSQWVLIYFFWKRIAEYFRFFGRKTELLEKYMHLLKFVEEREFQAEYLLELQKKVKRYFSASDVFKELKNLVKQFEYRQNLLVGFFLNSVFLWDIRCVYKLWLWHNQNRKKLTSWLDVIAEMDALISIANFAENHPEYIFPEIHEGDFVFRTKKLGHPLLHRDKRICNDLEIEGWNKAIIVTGANMAGKSTFLRTVGVNLILGRLGAPVCAEKMILTPIAIYTNMRTTDSLLKDESYFYAELKRLKGVLERLEMGEAIFVILDEMLKGTNSVDKLNGSKELIRKLVQFNSVSLIATHDLKLGELETGYPQQIINKCFEIKIENDEMVFDYLLTDGITKTMNATFLMKKMGII